MIELPDFYRGDDFALQILVRNKETQTPVPINGWVLTSSLKLTSELADEPEMNPEGYRQVLRVVHQVVPGDEATSGRTTLIFPHEQTAELLATRYRIDIQAEHDDVVQTLFSGIVPVLADITRDTYDVPASI